MKEHLLTKTDSFQKEMKTRTVSLASRMDLYQAKTETSHEELMAIMKVGQEKIEAVMEACL
jgi:hypothetical protein